MKLFFVIIFFPSLSFAHPQGDANHWEVLQKIRREAKVKLG